MWATANYERTRYTAFEITLGRSQFSESTSNGQYKLRLLDLHWNSSVTVVLFDRGLINQANCNEHFRRMI